MSPLDADALERVRDRDDPQAHRLARRLQLPKNRPPLAVDVEQVLQHSVRMAVRRIMPYHESSDFEATRAFYTRVLGLEEGSFGGGYIGFGSGQAQVVFAPPGVQPVLPDIGVDVDSREAVDAAHAEAVQAGHEVIYGPVDEPWGVRRFFVRDPQGVVISVLAHD
jgi:predicted enzyme related to lactoylglutathione lyase